MKILCVYFYVNVKDYEKCELVMMKMRLPISNNSNEKSILTVQKLAVDEEELRNGKRVMKQSKVR